MSYSKLTCIGNIGSINKLDEKIVISVADNINEKETIWYSCFLSVAQTQRYSQRLNIGDRILIEGRPLPVKVSDKGEANIRLLTNHITILNSKKMPTEFTADEVPF